MTKFTLSATSLATSLATFSVTFSAAMAPILLSILPAQAQPSPIPQPISPQPSIEVPVAPPTSNPAPVTPSSSNPIQQNLEFITNLNKAKNLARQAAERANGGLALYRADSLMHGPAATAPYVDNGDGTVTFTFTGGSPGYTQPTVESAVTVDTNTWTVTVDYNGAVRSASQ